MAALEIIFNIIIITIINSKMSTQADRMREKFRQEIRARQISEILRIQRSKLLLQTSENNMFGDIDKRIRSSTEGPMEMEMVQ